MSYHCYFHWSCLYSCSWSTCCTITHHSIVRLHHRAAEVALWCWKMQRETHMRPGLVLLAKFGVWFCGLAKAFIFSICSHLRSNSCACLWEAFSFCLVMSALSRKTSPCFSSVQGHTHTQTPLAKLFYWRWLIKIATINVIVTIPI